MRPWRTGASLTWGRGLGFGLFPTAQGLWSFGAMGVSPSLVGACLARRRRRLAMASVCPGDLRSFGHGALRRRPWPLPWRLLRARWAPLLGACSAPRRAGLCPRLVCRRVLLQVGRRTVGSCTVRFCPRVSAAPSLCALSRRRHRALCGVLVPCVSSHCRPVCRAHVTRASLATTTCAPCGQRRGLVVGGVGVGAGRQWLRALGTVCLRLLALWSSHLLCAATPRRAACINRQIESTAAVAPESQSLLCGAVVGRLRPTRCLVPGFVAGRVRKQRAVASLRCKFRRCGAGPVG